MRRGGRVASSGTTAARSRSVRQTGGKILKLSLLKSTVVAALGGLLFGFDTVVISGTTQALTELYHLSPFALGVTVTSALIGTIVGSLTAGIPGDAIGRRDSLRFMAVLYFISAVGCAFSSHCSFLLAFLF